MYSWKGSSVFEPSSSEEREAANMQRQGTDPDLHHCSGQGHWLEVSLEALEHPEKTHTDMRRT